MITGKSFGLDRRAGRRDINPKRFFSDPAKEINDRDNDTGYGFGGVGIGGRDGIGVGRLIYHRIGNNSIGSIVIIVWII